MISAGFFFSIGVRDSTRNSMTRDYTSVDADVFLPTYRRLPIEIDRAEGAEIVARDGTRYLDLLGGIAVNAAGHSHPSIIEAVERQVRRYAHVSNFLVQDAQVEFAERLTRLSGYPHLFLSNSGTEAIEGALKLVRKHGSERGRSKVIAFEGAFHGRSYGALSLMHKPKYKEGMGPFLQDIVTLPYNDVERLREEIDGNTAGIFVEFLQGEGGIIEASSAFIEELSTAQKEHNLLIVADEIQAGAGRTGEFFSFSSLPIHPDLVTMAKVIGGGLPLGAILATEALRDVWGPGAHGTTFGGNPVSCAAGSALLDLLEDGLMESAAETGTLLKRGLRALQELYPSTILDIRGRGCIIGVLFPFDASDIVSRLLERGIVANATSTTVLRLLPPYLLAPAQVDRFVNTLGEVIESMDS